MYYLYKQHAENPASNFNGDRAYLKKYGPKLSTKWGEVEECFTKLNAIKALKLRKLSLANYTAMARYLGGRNADDPDAHVGSMLDAALKLGRDTDVEDKEFDRHADRHEDGNATQLAVCNDWRKWRTCSYGDTCRFAHAQYLGELEF